LPSGEPTRVSAQYGDVLQNRASRSPLIRQSPVWLRLPLSYGSGVTIKELSSIAVVISLIGKLPLPSREERRTFQRLIAWYEMHWSVIQPVLPLVQLRDGSDSVIDGTREIFDLASKL
jgi:hypothetical protein